MVLRGGDRAPLVLGHRRSAVRLVAHFLTDAVAIRDKNAAAQVLKMQLARR